MGKEIRQFLAAIRQDLDSDLSLNQKLELTIPVIPYFLEYKVELGAGVKVDLNSVWEELKERVECVQKGKNDIEAPDS